DDRALRRLVRDLAGRGEGSAGGDAAENSLAARERPRRVDGRVVLHRQDAIRYRPVEDGRHEVWRPSLDLVRGERLAREERGAGGLGGDDLHVRPGESDHLPGAGQRTAGAPARDEVVQALAG